ncbi:MAG: HAMP domain-containing histidine kinase, partial [Anaerolineae bacterium]|nr:HAMP domain-containing histidine kinase [Anaerolineae bacterium]
DEAGEADTREELEIVETLVSYNEALAAYRALVQAHASVEDSDLQLLADIESAGQVLLDSADAVVNGLEANDSLAEIIEAREALEDGERTFLAVIEVALAEEFADLEESEAIVSQTADILTRLAFASIFLTLLLVIGASLYLFSTVLRPMLNLTQTAQRLGAGDLTARSSDSAGDEIGQFAATFNMMADSIQQQISATEAARARAERSDQVKSSFLASVSHELRTPLNAIINFTRFVVDGDTGPVNEQQRELLTEVVGSGRHLLSLINDVLDMSKIEAGALSLFIEDGVDVNALLKTALTTTQNLLGDKPVALVTQIDPALPLIRADKQRVLQILLNILGNAAKFTAQGSITVTARPQGDSVLIAVQDTGPGIAVADQPKVFEAFQQATEGLRQGGGTGLGMPISKSLAEAHGGQLWLESTPGQGATFSVRLPVASTALVASL